MTAILKILFWICFLSGAAVANPNPSIELGKTENYCVIYCYVRVPFTISNYNAPNKIGRVFCDFEAEVTANLPIYNGETKTKSMKASQIGVFKNDTGKVTGDIEMSTGILKKYFVGAKVNNLRCHL